MYKYCIGIDVGKTNTKIVCVNSANSIVYRKKIGSAFDSKRVFLESLNYLIDDAKSSLNYPFTSVGICLPGPVNFFSQCLLYIPGVSSIKNLLSIDISNQLGIQPDRVVIENDCTAAAFGELIEGNLVKTHNSILLSIGTGIGIGIIINETPYHGKSGFVGQIGHSILKDNKFKCYCGQIGCYETILSTNEEKSGLENNIDNTLYHKVNSSIGNLLGCIINLLNIERVLLLGEPFKNQNFKQNLVKHIKKNTLQECFNDCFFVDSKLGIWAGAIGAAFISRKQRM